MATIESLGQQFAELIKASRRYEYQRSGDRATIRDTRQQLGKLTIKSAKQVRFKNTSIFG